MKSWIRMAPLVLAVAAAAPLAAAVDDFTWDAQAQPMWAGTPADPTARQAEMAALQKSLAGRQVSQALERQVVVNLSASERKRIDVPGPADGKYLVGVNRPVGVLVSFPSGAALGKRTRDLAIGAIRGATDGSMVWTAALRAPGATAMRAHLSGVDLPPGAALFVYNLAGMAFGPYTARGPVGNGDLFTHTVFGEQILLQLVVPSGVTRLPSIRVDEVAVLGQRFLAPKYGPEGAFDANDLEQLAGSKAFCSYNATCVVNAACNNSGAVSCARQAVASILFGSGGSQYICTGGLIGNNGGTTIPYFLTAHHCISSSGEASSVETYFDYTTTCNSPNCTQPYSNAGDTVGSTIKATGSSSDYSLLQLSSIPGGSRCYLGWATNDISTSTTQLYRISHPKGAPQAYSEQRVDPSKPTCRSLPRGSFLYSKDNLGATEGGSSGSPVVNGSGQIVGQLYGACGTNLNNVCDANSNATVDGAFAASYPNLSSFLNPGGGGGGCTLLPSGAACTTDSQCCSNSCKGKPTAKTCR